MNDTLTYRSVDATSDITGGSVKVTCKNTIGFKVDTDSLQAQGTTEVWVYDVQQGEEKGIIKSRDNHVTGTLEGKLEDGVCNVTTEVASWYIMAFTIDTTPRVAEYHDVQAIWDGKAVGKLESRKIPGEFIKGRPACPPKYWEKAYPLFKNKLGECSPEER